MVVCPHARRWRRWCSDGLALCPHAEPLPDDEEDEEEEHGAWVRRRHEEQHEHETARPLILGICACACGAIDLQGQEELFEEEEEVLHDTMDSFFAPKSKPFEREVPCSRDR